MGKAAWWLGNPSGRLPRTLCVNGFRIIQTSSRYRVSDSGLDTYVFDGMAYRFMSHAIVDFYGLEQWSRRMRAPK